jgi:hypothetical protein
VLNCLWGNAEQFGTLLRLFHELLVGQVIEGTHVATSRRSTMRPSIFALPMVAATAADAWRSRSATAY